MIQPIMPARLKEIFSDETDGWEMVIDYWDEIAAAVCNLVDELAIVRESDRLGWEMYDKARVLAEGL